MHLSFIFSIASQPNRQPSMNKQSILKYIELNQLDEAIGLIEKSPDHNSEATNALRARLRVIEKEQKEGSIDFDQFNDAKEKIKQRLVELVNEFPELPPVLQKSNRIRVVLLAILGGVAAILGLLSYNQTNTGVSNVFISDLTQELQGEYQEFVYPEYYLTTAQKFNEGDAFIKRNFSWNADFNYIIDSKSIQLNYSSSTKELQIAIPKIQLLEKFNIKYKQVNTIENSNWAQEDSRDDSFWDEIEQNTAILLDVQIPRDKTVQKRLKETVEASIQERVKQKLIDNNYLFINIIVTVNALELLSGERLIL